MSDGEVNLALLQYKSEVGSDLKDASSFVGIHHFGFQADNLEEQQAAIEARRRKILFDLGEEGDEGFERKFKDPNGIIFDINDTGWTMTASKKPGKKSK
jgi:hypothetical protein